MAIPKIKRECVILKKLINKPEDVEQQMIAGIIKAHGQYVSRIEGFNVLIRANKKQGKVALVSGGGSGHEPSHGGFVGEGMLDAAVCGAVFTSPTPDQVYEAIKAVDAGAGVLLIIKNYTGDVLNFEMAAEMAEADGIKVLNVVVNDDVAVMDSLYTTGRRGVAGTVLVHKIAGAAAEAGATLEEVQAIANKVIANVRTMGMALTACTVPAAGKPGFDLTETEMEMGIGIHGEPGTYRSAIKTADEITNEMMEKILTDMPLGSSDEAIVLVNGFGGTPVMELYVINNRVYDILTEKGVKIYHTMVGDYMTSIEMAGCSITVLKLDAEMKKFFDAKASTIALQA